MHKKKKPVARDRFEDPDLLEAEALIAGLAEDDGEYVEVTKKSRSSKKKRRNTDALYDDGNISHVSVKKATPKKKAAPEPEYDEYDDYEEYEEDGLEEYEAYERGADRYDREEAYDDEEYYEDE